jgi:transcriptional regulator CtsR
VKNLPKRSVPVGSWKGSVVMRLSEVIEQYIKEMMTDTDDFVEFQRNELAQYFKCVPSQINYVISTRFSPENGYYVESKRGGGGNIKIKRVDITKDKYIMHIINSVGSNLSQQEVDILIRNFLEYGVISQLEAKLLKVATSDKVLNLPVELKDIVRTRIFKNMLINLI